MWRPRTLRVRYTLRTLFVFITALCIWGGLQAQRAWTLHRIEQVLARHHAVVRYGRMDRSEGLRGTLWLAYEWMARIVWMDRGVANVSIYSDLDPEVVAALRALPHFDTLRISGLHYTPAAIGTQSAKPTVLLTTLRRGSLQELLATTHLRALTIEGCIVSDADLSAISQQHTLTYLALGHTHVPEAALADFVRLPRLHELVVEHSDVTGRDLHGVPGSTSLEIVKFSQTPVGVEFAKYIARCPSVVELHLFHKSVNDDFVAELHSHPSIKYLPLFGTSITDNALQHLAQMPSLAVVRFDDSVTKAAMEEFQHRHPGSEGAPEIS